MLKIAMCDDNLDTTLSIKNMLESELIEQNVDAQIIKVTDNQKEIEELIKNKEIDLLILDVEFDNSELDGIEFAKKLRKYNKEFYLVFLSAHQRFLYPALITKIFDYLVKPANRTQIADLVSRIKEEYAENTVQFIKISKWQTIRASEILYLEKSINKTIIYTTSGEFSCSKTLDQMLDILPKNFIRSHRSFILNKEHLINIDKKEKLAYLDNGFTCPINDKFEI